jgi:hypothetical protein
MTIQRAPNTTAFRGANLSPIQIMNNLFKKDEFFDVKYFNAIPNPKNLSLSLINMDKELFDTRG